MSARYDMLATKDRAFVQCTYARKPVLFVKGQGMRLFDEEGVEYLDFVSGIGAVNLGHAHPAVTEAVCDQVAKVVHVSNLYHVEHRAELAEDLSALLGGGWKAFFCNSGAEACEGAIKIARRWGVTHKGRDATRIITAERSFHGRTLATLAATGQPSKQDAFAPLMPGFTHVPLNDVAALDAQMDETVCAVMLEVIQGEGGVYPCDADYLAAARRLCDERGALLVLDEVQTGFWRTGEMPFAHQAYGVKPDVVALAKAMANGLPAGAVMAHGAAGDTFQPGDHGSTFGGGPVICAAARATTAALSHEELGVKAARQGAYLRARLEALAEGTGAISEVRGRGLMMAVHLAHPIAADLSDAALARGILLNNIGTEILRLLPPLVCGRSEIDTLLQVLTELIEDGVGKS
ncbi:MAG: acetylornithine/succinylornithine family transaminase [Coriobacteriia bacterium]|jgi:predicted acetylornithine/succinylornithine family transaminase|nr:acetylornithine/succinylornithine family transaminase [Coriobacteriia bacterium]